MYCIRFAGLLVTTCCFISFGHARLLGIPTVPFNSSVTGTSYSFKDLQAIIVDSRYANSSDSNGYTLIPPTLSDFANTFSSNFAFVVGSNISVYIGSYAQKNSVFLTIGSNSAFQDAAGRFTSEAYSLDITNQSITVTGASPLGTWWGTITLIQQAVLGNLSIPFGSGVDSPGWGTRGVMMDIGRHYYPPDFLVEMCSYLSFFKQNVFHLHMSDNLYNNVDIYSRERSLDLYSAFRPYSEDEAVAGLNWRTNESYSRRDLDYIQEKCASRGVTIIPELEAPGHALVIVQWKPELGLDDLSLLNISYPDTIPTMKTIWNVFLPWFHSKVVHIGADEYTGPEADYITFVNDINEYIQETSSKDIRIWGTFTPYTNGSTNVNTSVSIQHWEFFEANPYWGFIKNGYDVLNSDDAFYVVNKWSGSYPQILNLTRVFKGSPSGGPYAPNIFDTSNSTNNPSRNNEHVLGQAAALWNDYGPNATTVLEAYYALRDVLPALGDKQWGGDLTLDEYYQIFDTLQAAVPAQNLDRRITSKSDTILQYTFEGNRTSKNVMDSSGNGYNGVIHGCSVNGSTLFLSNGCYIETPLKSKGRNYTLSFSIKPTSDEPGTLFSGPDSSLLAGNGSITNVTMISGGNAYSLNYSLPVDSWTDVSLIGRGNATYFTVQTSNSSSLEVMEFSTKMGINGEYFVWGPMGIEAPLARIGEGFEGQMRNVTLLGSA
ncbi:MAG: hypothetical protein M1834_004521 [Cirrosporium novae-zelandiae]|nr:MAG: hypothetical protein M1834_004521 [Cirrosporium novae-zelandiae]